MNSTLFLELVVPAYLGCPEKNECSPVSYILQGMYLNIFKYFSVFSSIKIFYCDDSIIA